MYIEGKVLKDLPIKELNANVDLAKKENNH